MKMESVGGGGGEREVADTSDVDGGNGGSGSGDSSYQQRYDMQQVSRWVEQILPFSLLLMIVFIRQHLQGFFVTIYVSAFMYKSNDILRKQTALKGERKFSVLAGYYIVFVLQVIGVYWWYQNEDLCYPLFMVPPRAIPPSFVIRCSLLSVVHAIFTILVNDTMVRQSTMAFKLVLLMYYRNGKGHNFRRQGQMLTLVEYGLLLYHAFLPAPVWYRFFLNKEYGSLFSSLTTGLYLTLKLTSVVEKVGSFWTALKALSRKEVHYGSNTTPEQDEASIIRGVISEEASPFRQQVCKSIADMIYQSICTALGKTFIAARYGTIYRLSSTPAIDYHSLVKNRRVKVIFLKVLESRRKDLVLMARLCWVSFMTLVAASGMACHCVILIIKPSIHDHLFYRL